MRRAVGVALVALLGCGEPQRVAVPTLFGRSLPASCRSLQTDSDRACAAWLVDGLIVGSHGRYRDPQLEGYVNGLGERLAAAADPKRRVRRWTFQILDDPDVAAYAQLAGHVYVSRGTLAVLGSEAELAAVLSHEIAHVVAGHSESFWQRLAESPGTGGLRQFERERDDERQADELAVVVLKAAGYDPRALPAMLKSLHRADATETEATQEVDEAERTHPRIAVRLARAWVAIGEHRGGGWYRDRYLDQIDGLVLGDDPRSGRVAEGVYVSARTGLALEPGAGWAVKLVDAEFRGRHKTQPLKLALRPIGGLHGVAIVARLAETVSKRVAGHDAEIGWLNEDKRGDSVRRIALIETRAGIVTIVVQGVSRRAVGPAFAAVLRSLRRARADELGAEPLRIKLIPIRKSGSVGALAKSLCDRQDITVFLEGGKPASRRKRGQRLKCTR